MVMDERYSEEIVTAPTVAEVTGQRGQSFFISMFVQWQITLANYLNCWPMVVLLSLAFFIVVSLDSDSTPLPLRTYLTLANSTFSRNVALPFYIELLTFNYLVN